MFFYGTLLISLLMIKCGLVLYVRYPRLGDVLGILGTIILLVMTLTGMLEIYVTMMLGTDRVQ